MWIVQGQYKKEEGKYDYKSIFGFKKYSTTNG